MAYKIDGEANTPSDLASLLFLLSGALVLPLIYFDNLIDPVLIPRFSFLAAMLSLSFAVVLFSILFGSFRMPRWIFSNVVFLSIAGYFAISLVALCQATNRVDGLYESLKVFLLMGTFIISCWVFGDIQRWVGWLIGIVAACSTLLAVIAIFQYFDFPFNDTLGFLSAHFTIDATMGNQNLLASYLLICFPFVAVGSLVLPGFRQVLLVIVAMLVMYVMLLLQSRAIWVAFAASLVAALAAKGIWFSGTYSIFQGSRVHAIRLARLVGFLLIAVVLGMLTYSDGTPQAPMKDRIESIVDPQHPTVNGRFDLWKKSIRMVQEHPILGVGPGNWKIHYPAYGLTGTRGEYGKAHAQRPHNDLLWILAETGPIGLICYMLIFAAAAVFCIRSIRKQSNVELKILSLMMLFGLVSYFIVSIFSYPRERIVHQFHLAILLGVTLSNCAPRRPRSELYPRYASFLIGVAYLGISLFSLAVGCDRYVSETHARKLLVARAQGDVDGALSEASLAHTRFYVMDPAATPLRWYRGVAYFTKGDLERATSDFEEALHLHPNHLQVLNNLASCYEQSGRREDAVALYERALEISARFEPALINLAAVCFHEKKYQYAYDLLSRCTKTCRDPRRDEYMKIIQRKMDDTKGNNLK